MDGLFTRSVGDRNLTYANKKLHYWEAYIIKQEEGQRWKWASKVTNTRDWNATRTLSCISPSLFLWTSDFTFTPFLACEVAGGYMLGFPWSTHPSTFHWWEAGSPHMVVQVEHCPTQGHAIHIIVSCWEAEILEMLGWTQKTLDAFLEHPSLGQQSHPMFYHPEGGGNSKNLHSNP